MPATYFQAYQNYFWQWEDHAEVVAIPNGSTIAYKSVVADAIELLSQQGLPPFGSLLLALLALNPRGEDNVEQVRNLVNDSAEISVDLETETAFKFLDVLTKIPEMYKTGKRKIYVLQVIFEKCHDVLSLKRSAEISGTYRRVSQAFFEQSPAQLKRFVVKRDFRVIGLLLRKFDTPDAILEKLSELPELPEEVEVEETVIEEPTDFVGELVQNYHTQKVGSLIKVLWAGLKLPLHSSVPSQQPIGGVSDVTNKGSFDRLLISEFANEDEVFLSRLANNEALYLNRESPPTENNLKRVILLDVSLKNWGVPKTIALATALAIAKHPKTGIECEVYCVGGTAKPVAIDTVNDIVAALQEVDAVLDPANGIASYFEVFPPDKSREIFVLSERSTKDYAAMQKGISEWGQYINYWILNGADGEVDVYRNKGNSRKHLQHLVLPYHELWKQQRKTKKGTVQPANNGEFCPVLLRPLQNSAGIFITDNGEIFQVTKEKSVLHFHTKHARDYERGWDLVFDNCPLLDSDIEIGYTLNGDYIMLLYHKQQRILQLINLYTHETINCDFPHWRFASRRNFFFHDQFFWHLNSVGAWKIDLDGGITKEDTSDLIMLGEKQNKRQAKLEEVERRFSYRPGILKNIRSVDISADGCLRMNRAHGLVIVNNYIKMERRVGEIAIAAEREGKKNKFRFPDGSLVINNRSGFLELRSSDERIPTIYVPSVLDASLGVATEDTFAGRKYFYNEPLFELVISGNLNRMEVVKVIKDTCIVGLGEARDLTFQAKAILPALFDWENAEKVQSSFEEINVDVEIVAKNPNFQNPLEIIQANDFFSRYIQEFIHVIQSYGTTT